MFGRAKQTADVISICSSSGNGLFFVIGVRTFVTKSEISHLSTSSAVLLGFFTILSTLKVGRFWRNDLRLSMYTSIMAE